MASLGVALVSVQPSSNPACTFSRVPSVVRVRVTGSFDSSPTPSSDCRLKQLGVTMKETLFNSASVRGSISTLGNGLGISAASGDGRLSVPLLRPLRHSPRSSTASAASPPSARPPPAMPREEGLGRGGSERRRSSGQNGAALSRSTTLPPPLAPRVLYLKLGESAHC